MAGRRSSNLARAAVATLVAVVFLLPLWFMASGSLREPGTAPPRSPELIPRPASLESYDRAFELVDLGRYALNSLVVAALVVPLSVLVASLAGFALRRAR